LSIISSMIRIRRWWNLDPAVGHGRGGERLSQCVLDLARKPVIGGRL